MDILALLFPKEKKFFAMVEKQVVLVASAVADFHRLITAYEKLTPLARKKLIKNISLKEQRDDVFYSEMVRGLKSTFITPIDREDLHQLVATFDMIIDTLEIITLKINIFGIEKIGKPVRAQTEILSEAFKLTEKLIFSIRNERLVEQYCLKIRKLEQEADIIYIKALENLFSDSQTALNIIKFKDLHSSLEHIINKISEASLIIENIAVKYS